MRPPFPGMDPWLEHPNLWLDLHNQPDHGDPPTRSFPKSPRITLSASNSARTRAGPAPPSISAGPTWGSRGRARRNRLPGLAN